MTQKVEIGNTYMIINLDMKGNLFDEGLATVVRILDNKPNLIDDPRCVVRFKGEDQTFERTVNPLNLRNT